MNKLYQRFYTSAFALLISLTGIAQSTNPSPYCDGKFDDVDGTFPVNDQIKSVSIGTLTNASNAQFAAPHYVFYNNLATPNLTIGSSYQLSLKFYVAGGSGYGVWIDYNRNSVFDANEKVAGSTANGWLALGDNIAANSTITIPATALSGTTRMRVRIVEDDMYTAVNGANIAACNTGTSAEAIMDWGETEDYTVMLIGSATNNPAVNSTVASTITTTTATLGGSVNANGGASCTVSFEYGTTTSYGQTKAATPATVTGSTLTNVTGAITGLTSGTLYHYRTKVVVGNQSYFGSDKTFTTLTITPVVNSTAASTITTTTATLGGNVNASGGASCTVSFEYGTTTAYGQTKAATPATVTGTTLTNVSGAITGLTPGTLYHYRTKVVAGNQSYFGPDKTFTTLYVTPTVTSTSATAVTSSEAVLGGTVNANSGSNWTVSFEFGTTTAYGQSKAATPGTVTGNVNTPVSALVISLLPNTTYHYRTKAVSGAQTVYGADKTFLTLIPQPIVNSTTATSITPTTATLGGSVSANGGLSCTVSFEFGTTINYGSTAIASPNSVIGSTLINVSGTANGLIPATLYHYRTKVVTNGQSFYGPDKTFTTQVATSVNPEELTEVLSFFPNPAQDFLQVNIPEKTGECVLSVFSVSGKEVLHSVCLPGLNRIQVAELPVGLYQIRLLNGKKVVGKGSFIH
jgi:phosphodiesterase/alkaline phosphatase D-like protein